MSTDIDVDLGAFDEGDLSVRLVRAVCTVVPFAPPVGHWWSLVEGLQRLDPEAKKPVLDRARALAAGDELQRALTLLQSLDTADSGLSVVSGVRSAVGLYQARSGTERLDALDTDTQQAVDAVLKGLALAFAIHRLFPGSVAEKVQAFRQTETGQALVYYYAAVEVALPFADNAVSGGAGLVSSLLERYGDDQVGKIAAVSGQADAEAAVSVFRTLIGPIETMVGMAASHVGSIAEAATGALGAGLAVGDKLAGAAATGADVLPVYKFLGARLVAEVALRRALDESKAEQAAKEQRSAAAVPVKFTRSADDLPDAPARRRGCFGLFGALLLVAISSGSTLLTALLWAFGTVP